MQYLDKLMSIVTSKNDYKGLMMQLGRLRASLIKKYPVLVTQNQSTAGVPNDPFDTFAYSTACIAYEKEATNNLLPEDFKELERVQQLIAKHYSGLPKGEKVQDLHVLLI